MWLFAVSTEVTNDRARQDSLAQATNPLAKFPDHQIRLFAIGSEQPTDLNHRMTEMF